MTGDTYCPHCRLGRLDEDGICLLCGTPGPNVARHTRWALTLGHYLSRINFTVLAPFAVIGALLALWFIAPWVLHASPLADQIPATANQFMDRSRTTPWGLLLDMLWRSLALSLVATSVIVTVAYVLWKRRQGQAQRKGQRGPGTGAH